MAEAMERDLFKKFFPHLAKEMEKGTSRAKLDEQRDQEKRGNMENSRKWAGHDPSVVDFIRRCETVEQALEVVEYLERRGEVTPRRAADLRLQLEREGLRGFGTMKKSGFYHRNR